MKKNHLIVVPRIVNAIGDWYQFPLGIAYISSSVEAAGYNLYKLNLNTIPGSIHDILKEIIDKYHIDTVMTGGLTGQYGALYDIVKNVKQIDPDIVTMVGGGMITSAPEHAMVALEYADYGVIGEGEIICCELLDAIENNKPVQDVPGVVYREKDEFIITSGKPAVVDINAVPFPDYKGLGLGELMAAVPNTLGMCEFNTMPIITSRSCPYQCTFCFHPSGQKFRQRNLDSVFEEIDYLVKEFNVKYLSIQDELFGFNVERVREFCDRIRPYEIRWLANFRVTEITPEVIEILKYGNCGVVAFGIESADNTILKSMKKHITIEDTERALKLVYDAGLGIQGVFIFGDVEETRETAQKTIDWWKEHIHYELQLSAIITYPGTPIYKYAIKEGIIKDPVQFIKDACPVVRLSRYMNDEDYRWLFSQLATLPRMLHTFPRDVEIAHIDYVSGCIDVKGKCKTCGTDNEWFKSRLFVLETLACHKCGRRHIAPVPQMVSDLISKNIDKLVEHFGSMAFWGVNSYFHNLVETLHPRNMDKVYCIDKSDVRCGLDIGDHTIQAPDIIIEKGIKCVAVAVIQYYSALKYPIQSEYPQLDGVISISDMLAEDFDPSTIHK